MVYLPVSLDTIEVIIDEIFTIIRAQKDMEDNCPEVAFNAAWFKLYGIERLFEDVEPFIECKETLAECYKIRELLSETMLEIEVLAEKAMFAEGGQ